MASTQDVAVEVRPALPADIPSITAIHRHYVLNTVLTFALEPSSDEATLESYCQIKSAGLPYIVAQSKEGIIGYCYVSPFSARLGYRYTLLLSLFCHPDHVRQGVGKKLLTRMVEVLKNPQDSKEWCEGGQLVDYPPRQLLAITSVDVDGPGQGWSLRDWYVNFGFVQVGQLKEVGQKKGRWIDTVYLQTTLRDS